MLPACLFFSCTTPAEHSNPLDPESPAFTESATISGTVTRYYQPFLPLANVEVRLFPGPALVLTNNDGAFSFRGLAPGVYQLQARLPRYAADTLVIRLSQRQTLTTTIRLNGLPRVDSVSIFTARVSRQPDSTRFFLNVQALTSDPDGPGDVKRVQIVATNFSFADTLAQVGRGGVWQRQFSQEELPPAPLPSWPGHPLHVRVEDFPGQETLAGPFFVVRVVQEVPEPIAPINNEVIVSSPLRFRWQVVSIPYPYTQEVEIFKIDAGFPSFFTAIRNIARGTTIAAFPGGLPPSGNYFWTVKIVDEFGNWSRSKEAVFQVQRP